MFNSISGVAPVLAIGFAAVVIAAPPAGALPECTNTTPVTTRCETNGSTQISTSPQHNTSPWYGYYPFGGFFFGFG